MTTESDERRVASALEYWPAAPPWGWQAGDLDHFPSDGPNGEPDFFRHVELLAGALVFSAPATIAHDRVAHGLADRFETRLPDGWSVAARPEVNLSLRTRARPDVLLAENPSTGRTCYEAHEVRLVVEVVTTESKDRDRHWKRDIYAQAGVRHHWRVEEDGGGPVVYAYELIPATRTYTVAGIHRRRLEVSEPFPIVIDLDALPR